MDINQLHFSQPLWLFSLLFIPLVWGLYFLYYQREQPLNQLEKFIDKHLIPFLLQGGEQKRKKLWIHLFFWSFAWSCLVIALAGPRWEFRETTTFTKDQSLAILLDLSESMNAKDIPPSRLGRAKQKMEDLLNMSKGVKIGLIAFAADPHIIVPMTEDKETIRHLLPSLETDLVYVQGSKLAPALEMAAKMLENEPGKNKAIVVISDGGFEDASAIYTAKKLGEEGIVIYTMGVGSLEGVPLKDSQGLELKKNGSPILSRLEKEKFSEISKVGHGRYFDADHSERLTLIFEDLGKRSDIQQEAHKTQRFWEEHFYLFLLPVLPFFLWWYRRGSIFVVLLFSFMPTYSHASLSEYFYNSEQQAQQTYEKGDYTSAGNVFQDDYRKGVAYYRMGDFKAAEEMFRQSSRPEVASGAAYNLGNALAQQNKLKDAIVAYENVLAKWPDHKQAKENLELVKKMLEQQEQQQQQNDDDSNQENSDQQKNKQDQQGQDKSKDNSQKQDSEEQSKEQSQNQKPPQNDPTSSEKEPDNAQKQEKPELEKSSQDHKEENVSQQDMDEAQPPQEQTSSSQQERGKPKSRSQEDLDADLWLDQIKNDPKKFLKNKFYLESKKNGTKAEGDPW